MDKTQRAELLRLRFRAVGGIPYQPSGKPLRYRHSIIGRDLSMCWDGGPPRRDDRAPHWIGEPDQKPKPVPRPKNNQCESPLTKIARQWRVVKPRPPAQSQSAR